VGGGGLGRSGGSFVELWVAVRVEGPFADEVWGRRQWGATALGGLRGAGAGGPPERASAQHVPATTRPSPELSGATLSPIIAGDLPGGTSIQRLSHPFVETGVQSRPFFHVKMQKVFRILRHIAYIDTCMEH
jgi:hypothetical protein